MTTKTMATNIYGWMDERLGISELAAFARKKTVPVHAQSFWYYWGGITLFLFMLQCFTGVLLLVYYRPGVEAYESVRQITFVMNFGWLIRSAHAWAANLMLFAILVHMFSVFFMKAYRKPREFGWLSGMVLLALAACFGFSGYLLPMDELSYFATKVGLQIPVAIPWVGPAIANMLRGGPDVTEFTVQRFFALHVVVLPALFIPLLAFHLWLVQRHGNACLRARKPSRPPNANQCRSCRTFCARTLRCGSSRLMCWRFWLRCFRGRWASRTIRSRRRRWAYIPSGTS
jgi:quinol-cytochrome oxidoreductase complex cytochrome b subunit